MAESDEIVRERRLQILEMSLGRDVMRYMHDDNVTEVIVNPDGKLWIDTFDKGFQHTGITIDEDEAKRVIYAVADLSGQTRRCKRTSPPRGSSPTAAFRPSFRTSSRRRASISASTPRSFSHWRKLRQARHDD